MTLGSLPVELLQSLEPFCDHRQLAALAQLNHHFHDIFNPLLYHHNAFKEDPSKSCVIWAAKHGSLSTMKLAFAHGASMEAIDAYTVEHIQTLYERQPGAEPYGGPLHIAVQNNFKDLTLFLLDNGARLDVPSYALCDCKGVRHDPKWYPLHFAICHVNEDMVSLLLEHGAYFSLKGVPGLRCAIQYESHSILDSLLEHENFDPHHRDLEGYTALCYVVNCADSMIAREMASKLADRGIPLDVMGITGSTALADMVEVGHFKAAIELLERGADPTISDWGDRGIGLFHDICCNPKVSDQEEQEPKVRELREDRRRLISLILANGVDPNRRMGHGAAPFSKPLFWVLMELRDVECVRILLDAGADIKSAFFENYETRCESLLRVFFALFGKPDPDALKKWDTITIGLDPYKECLCLLLERGARIDSLDGEWSALSKTCELATSSMGPVALEFLAENATCKNVELEHVELLRGQWETNETVHELLGQLHSKLLKQQETSQASKS
ncbi:hypothetical protein CEP51_000244 [Fusarium floridanum]|uniref:Uncharacterized protein n=1 Tax=Fusarium floridanum TaxID=1325733 RepID=A0A428SPA5_9HYPO|nr:hypothetical protein CEP51_000244 [Fusarium floridanum]